MNESLIVFVSAQGHFYSDGLWFVASVELMTSASRTVSLTGSYKIKTTVCLADEIVVAFIVFKSKFSNWRLNTSMLKLAETILW